MTFGAHKLVHSEPFLDYLYELAVSADCGSFFIYMCTSRPTFSVLNYCGGIFFKSLICNTTLPHMCYFAKYDPSRSNIISVIT